MKPTHIIHDQDNHFKLDPVTRTWTNATAQKPILIQGDHNSEVFTFELPLRIEGHLMSECDAVQVHYINIDTVTRAQSRGVYEVEDLQVNPDGSETITCSWVISRNATKYVGSLSFLLRFSCVQEDGTEYYVWHSAIDNSSVVSKGISNGDAIAEAYPDILAQWYQEIEKWKAETGNGSLAGVDWLATKEVIQEGSVVFPEVTKSFDGAMQFLSGVQMEIDPGLYYDVNWNGKIYTRQALVYDGETYLGNGRVVFGSAAGDLPDTGEPFGIVYNGGANLMLKKANTTTESITLSISTAGEYRYNKMPAEYLPDGIAKVDTATVGQTIVVKSVDENGKPTEWEAADLDVWDVHYKANFTEALTEGFLINEVDGKPLKLKEMWAFVKIQNAAAKAWCGCTIATNDSKVWMCGSAASNGGVMIDTNAYGYFSYHAKILPNARAFCEYTANGNGLSRTITGHWLNNWLDYNNIEYFSGLKCDNNLGGANSYGYGTEIVIVGKSI